MKLKRSIFIALLSFSQFSFAGGPNPNIKYYGYDWLDRQFGDNPVSNLDAISTTGFSNTNLNVVRTIDNLNSSACAANNCAIGISAGQQHWLDICPGATSDEECQKARSWNKIWDIVVEISNASNKPVAIYFIDEPFNAQALSHPVSETVFKYVDYRYSSYLCTLRQAMSAYGMNIPVFTILSHLDITNNEKNRLEIQNGAPSSACTTGDKSTPDWVGIDKYDWNTSNMWDTYNLVAPSTNPNSARWVLVPPATKTIIPETDKMPATIYSDDQLHAQIQLYWDFINQHPTAPVIYIMNWRFDPNVTVDRSAYPKSSALLSFMGNTITP